MPKGYIYAELEVTDPTLFETYHPVAATSIAAFGGRYAVRGGDRGAGGQRTRTTISIAGVR